MPYQPLATYLHVGRRNFTIVLLIGFGLQTFTKTSCFRHFRFSSTDLDDDRYLQLLTVIIRKTFFVICNFAASFNILVEWKPDFFLGGWRYCNRVFFYFCFFVSLAEYIIFAVLLLYICTNFAYSRKDDSEKPQTLGA